MQQTIKVYIVDAEDLFKSIEGNINTPLRELIISEAEKVGNVYSLGEFEKLRNRGLIESRKTYIAIE